MLWKSIYCTQTILICALKRLERPDYKRLKRLKRNIVLIVGYEANRCVHVGLDCDCVMNGATEEDVMRKAIEHIWQYHATKPEEMTSEMKVKIKENIQTF